MKVVIELIGNESKESLLATSNYLRELAGEAIPEAPERKTDLDKLADAVVEATKVEMEEKPKTVAEMVESERAKTRARRSAKVEPVAAEAEAKAAEASAAEASAAAAAAEAEAKAAAEASAAASAAAAAAEAKAAAAAETTYTIDDCKSWAMKALNAKKRPIVQEAFESVGASSFPTLKENMFNDFVAYISSRL